MREKATGWKVPLIFCAAIILILGACKVIAGLNAAGPDLPEAMLREAAAVKLSLDDAGGKKWMDKIVNAASSFAERDSKDKKLALLAEEALSRQRPDEAAAAIIMIKNVPERDKLLKRIFFLTSGECGLLPWAVFAIKSTRDSQEASAMLKTLNPVWEECSKK